MKNPSRDIFLKLQIRLARSVVPFAQICAFVLVVSTMLGLPAWGGDLVAVLFEFLDDDTKLAQSCNGLALRAALVHRRPGPYSARDVLCAHGSRRELSRVHSRHTAPFIPFLMKRNA